MKKSFMINMLRNFKKMYCLVCAAVICIVSVCMLSINATAATSADGFVYTASSSGVTITGYNGSASDLIIPQTIAGYPVISIEGTAFMSKSSLKTVVLPEGLQNLGMYAFASCYNLTSISIPNSVISVGQDPFMGCDKLQYNVWNDGKYLGNSENPYAVLVKMESGSTSEKTLHQDTVAICSYAFSNVSSLRKVVISGNVSVIPKGAFNGCSSLQEVVLPQTIVNIDENAFYNCRSLRNVNIPDGVKSIGRYAFYADSSLQSIRIPSSLTSIGVCAFEGCSGLQGVYITDLAAWCSISFGARSTLGPTANPLYYAHNLYLNNTLITDLVIPERVTAIGSLAFAGCNTLKTIVVPNSVASIGSCAFAGCTNVTSISLPYIGGHLGAYFGTHVKDGGNAFTQTNYSSNSYSTTTTTYYIPNNLHTVKVTGGSIGSCAFADWTSIETLYIGSEIKSIGKEAFKNCTGLNTVYITDPANWAKCSFASQYSNPLCVANNTHFIDGEGNEITDVVLQEDTTSIFMYAFKNAKHVVSIKVPKSVTTIGEGVFSGCSALENLELPFVGNTRKTENDTYQYPLGFLFGKENYEGSYSAEQNYYGSRLDRYTSDEYYIPNSLKTIIVTDSEILPRTFDQIYTAKSIRIPDGLTKIGHYAFAGCSSLENVNIPSGITEFPAGLFYGCKSINNKVVSIPAGVTAIGSYAFDGCINLTYVNIPDSVTTIGTGAFWGSGIETITIPASVTEISGSLFKNCSALETIKIIGNVDSIEGYAFQGCSSLCEISIPDSVTEIGDYAFEGCTNLEYIKLPEQLHTIYGFVFQSCTSLKSIIIPQNTKIIGPAAFRGCYALSDIYLPDGITNIDSSAFWECVSLETITLPASIKAIQSKTFADCISLRSVIVPNNVLSIEEDAFVGCIGLEAVVLPVSLVRVQKGAFNLCGSLGKVYYAGTSTEWGDVSISSNNIPLHNATKYFKHTHQYKENLANTKEATCMQEGYLEYVCSCGAIQRKYVARLPHTEVHIDAVAATCEEPGCSQGIYCKVCNRTLLNSVVVPAVGHDWGNYIDNNDATPEQDGTMTAVCSRDGCMAINTVLNEGSRLIPERIEIAVLPQKLSYLGKRDDIDPTGGEITIFCKDSEPVSRKMEREMLSGFDNTVPGIQIITVTYGGCAVHFEVEITTATVKFMNADGTLISQAEYMYGDVIVVPDDPQKPAGIDNSYVFRGWGHQVTTCTGEATYTAVFGPPYILGDIDGDESVTQDDAVYLLLYTMFGEAFYPLNNAPADIDNNGAVNQDDAVYLLLHSMFGEMFYPLNPAILPAKAEEQ